MDSVGRGLAGWLATMSAEDTDPLVEAVRQRIGRLARQFDRILDDVANDQDISRGDWTALSVLVRAGRPCTPSDLGRELGLTSGTVSTRIRRLAAAGFAAPAPGGGDARSRPITVTRRGRQRWRAATAERTRRERELLRSALDPQQLAAVDDGLAALLGALEQRLGAGGTHDLPRHG
ncbi:MarR family transcriptional regulator [Tsukamurella sp. 8F]|uniref:MarR family winged helix-turn-helix transcriptional regulator n=1 Tax=unclassified Tsukamurella TaxID=2633480 RepID=UPI0023BA0B6C|nr:MULTISPECIES: MarR family transcriptional regulator [unclassified Tsukamurella]MDF0530867.1 MarR family transcriptional regulator [Tsukamurella sp. 8J]MDF0588188.1 MarR family transcriptional regulator [Tsukamurella sp. 8F]